jgi:hypothetical protein
VPGSLQVQGNVTNLHVVGTNNWTGDLAYVSRNNDAIANGNNAGVILGTNVYVRLSGPTGAFTIAGFVAERNGSFHIVEMPSGYTGTLANQSGLDAAAANRIITGTGGDLTFTNQPPFIQVIYDGAAARWKVVSKSN